MNPMQALIALYLESPALAEEGRERHMYLDTAGLVTAGRGDMIPTAAAAGAMPFHYADTGSPVDVADIMLEFDRIQALPKGHEAEFYKSNQVLPDEYIDERTASRCQGFVSELQRLFPAFAQFPQPAQLALLDMTYNLGIGRAPTYNVRPTGLQEFTHLCAAVRARDWKMCALFCDRNTHMKAFDDRNAWTRMQFNAAPAAV